MNPVAVHRVSFDCVSRFNLIRRESGGGGFSGARIVNSRPRRLHAVTASLITSADSFEVGRLIGSYGFMNVTRYLLTLIHESQNIEIIVCIWRILGGRCMCESVAVARRIEIS